MASERSAINQLSETGTSNQIFKMTNSHKNLKDVKPTPE